MSEKARGQNWVPVARSPAWYAAEFSVLYQIHLSPVCLS